MPPDTQVTAVPAHVPDKLVVDFDAFAVPGAERDIQLAWRDSLLAHGEPVLWSPFNGGHWILTQADDIRRAQSDYEVFSNRMYQIPPARRQFQPLPLGVDPPEHRKYRMLITPAFAPKALRPVVENAGNVATSLIDDIAPLGQCEFVSAFAKILPVVVFLGMAGLPEEDRHHLLPLTEAFVRGSTIEGRAQAGAGIADYLTDWIARRQAQPGDDLVSHIANATIEGRDITKHETFGLLILLLNGGLDTVTSMMTMAIRHLAMYPEHRRELIDDPDLIPAAVEEIVRRYSMISTAREINQDVELHGVTLKKGDMVVAPTMLFNLSESKFHDPVSVDFHRPPAPHASFGDGTHKCPGANLARQEIGLLLKAWLAKIPDFELAEDHPPTASTGLVSSYRSLHLTWDLP